MPEVEGAGGRGVECTGVGRGGGAAQSGRPEGPRSEGRQEQNSEKGGPTRERESVHCSWLLPPFSTETPVLRVAPWGAGEPWCLHCPPRPHGSPVSLSGSSPTVDICPSGLRPEWLLSC